MTFLKLDVGFADHPRVAMLKDRSFRAHLSALLHCKAYQTDGAIVSTLPRQWRLRRAHIDELVSAGLWEVTPSGWQIHDWHDYNPSRAELSELRSKRQAAGRKGGRSRSKDSSKELPNPASILQAPAEPKGEELKGEELKGEELKGEDQASSTAALRDWEHATGTSLTPLLGEKIAAAVERHGLERVSEAIAETGIAGVKSWNYAAAILDRWHREGRRSKPSQLEADSYHDLAARRERFGG